MRENKRNLLTTGQAARLCSVTPDTILKWIKKGRLNGMRTAGGHYRIDRSDLQPLVVSPHPGEAALGPPPEYTPKSLRCWEYLGAGDTVRDDCRQCVVYRVRATRCFLMVDMAADLGHARQFCQSSCQDCVYYRRAMGLSTNVLVVSSDDEFVDRLAGEEHESITLRFAKNAYEASAIVHDFRPAFAVIDVESVPSGDDRLLDSLAADSRVPGLKIIVVVPPKASRRKRRRPKHGVSAGVLEKPLGSRRIAAVIDSFPVDFLPSEDGIL